MATVSSPLLVRVSEACRLLNTLNCCLILPLANANIRFTSNEACPANQVPPLKLFLAHLSQKRPLRFILHFPPTLFCFHAHFLPKRSFFTMTQTPSSDLEADYFQADAKLSLSNCPAVAPLQKLESLGN